MADDFLRQSARNGSGCFGSGQIVKRLDEESRNFGRSRAAASCQLQRQNSHSGREDDRQPGCPAPARRRQTFSATLVGEAASVTADGGRNENVGT